MQQMQKVNLIIVGVLALGAAGAFAMNTASADEPPAATRQRVLLEDRGHPGISIYCPGEQDGQRLVIRAADASNCTIILPAAAHKPAEFTCKAVAAAGGKAPLGWACVEGAGGG